MNIIVDEKQPATTTPGSLPKISTIPISHLRNSGIDNEATLGRKEKMATRKSPPRTLARMLTRTPAREHSNEDPASGELWRLSR
jgi:hypothetical protein